MAVLSPLFHLISIWMSSVVHSLNRPNIGERSGNDIVNHLSYALWLCRRTLYDLLFISRNAQIV